MGSSERGLALLLGEQSDEHPAIIANLADWHVSRWGNGSV